MNTTIFLAEVIGWYFVIMSLFILLQRKKILAIALEFTSQPALIFFTGVVTLILGLLMVVSHNLWVMDWRVIVTIISWAVLLAGLFRMAVPNMGMRIGQWWFSHQPYLILVALIYLLIGIYLLYKAFVI